MTNIARWVIFQILLFLKIVMTNETLKLVQSKQDSGLIMPMCSTNMLTDPSI
jgi:tellurite resistance protein TehA-like permease